MPIPFRLKCVRPHHVGPLLISLLVTACGDFDSNAASDYTPPDSKPPPRVIEPGNNGTLIFGTPPTEATVGQEWRFEPSVGDPDGDSVTVWAENLPDWMRLNTSTGALRGTPSDADVQSWDNIRLTVSDGELAAQLPAFTVTVVAQNAGNGSATLSWLPPTERVDGSPIGGALAGYRVLYGQSSGNYSNTVTLDNPGITRYVVEGLSGGTWYFAVQSITSDGLTSTPSAEGRKVI